MFKKNTILVPALLGLCLSGCGGMRYYVENRDANLVNESYHAVTRMHEKILHKIPKNSLIVVSTLLNIDDSNQTSSFGRIVSDQVASAFNNLGYQVIGMEIPIDLFVLKEGGRFYLSDETKAMLRHYRASTLVGGVYAPGKHNGYVSLRMVDINSKNIIASTDFSVPMGPDAKMMMKPKDITKPVGANTENQTSANEDSAAPSSQQEDGVTPLLEDNNLPATLEQTQNPILLDENANPQLLPPQPRNTEQGNGRLQ